VKSWWPLVFVLGCGSEAPRATHATTQATAEPLELAVAEVAAASGEGLGGRLRVRGGERFALVLMSASLAHGEASYRVAPPADGAALQRVNGCALGDKLASKAKPTPPAPQAKESALRAGDRKTFTMRFGDGHRAVPARVVAVGDATVVWADVSEEHPAELDAAFVSEFLEDFERIILRRGRQVFGVESDVDGDGRIALLFSPLTYRAAVAFFSACDLRPTCKGSNAAEVLYLTPPNAIPPPYNTPRAIKEILAHELEHLLHHRHKVLDNDLAADPDSAYMLEGFGALAQDVTGLQAGNLYVTKAGLDQIDAVSLADVMRESVEYDRERDGPLRGGAYLFVRWLYDRAGGDTAGPDGAIEDRGGPSLVRSLLADRRSIASSLAARVPSDDLVTGFYPALVLPAGKGCAAFGATAKDPITGRQRGADPFASFHGMAMQGAAMTPVERADGRLLLGGAEYLLLEAKEAGVLAFGVQVEAASAQAQLHVVRIE